MAIDEQLFRRIFQEKKQKRKVVIAINFADKIEPMNRMEELTELQIENLDKKVLEVKRRFGIHKARIVYVSAINHINVDILVRKMRM